MKIHTIHNGCEPNFYDSEKAKNLLLLNNTCKETAKEEADVIVFHGCTFSQDKENETKSVIKQLLQTTSKKIIISGCYLNEYVKDERIHYVKNEKLAAFINEMKKEDAFVSSIDFNSLNTTLSPFVSISRGCYGNCTFCSIKSAKGVHKSRPVNEILVDIEVRQHHGFVKLVADESAGYGRDIGIDLKTLVDTIITRFPNLQIKLGSLNVKLLKKYSTAELAMFAYQNISGNIHIPIQSASNNILTEMSRGYTIEEYQKIYNTLRKLGVKNISGDVICGFPGETEEDHQKNISFITSNKFSFMEIFAYQEREGTKAASLNQMDYSIRKKRGIEIIANYLKSYTKWHNISTQQLINQTRVFNTNIKFN